MRIVTFPFITFFLFCIVLQGFGQDTTKPFCGFGNVRAMHGFASHAQFKSNNNVNDVGQYFIIPVVVHIIHNGGVENLNDNIAQSQIDVLNEDFGHYGRGNNSFPFGGDARIRFCLATIDPDGKPTTGVNHIKSIYTDEESSDEMLTKSLSVWDVNRYMNIWVVKSIDFKESGGREVGYAYLANEVSRLPDPNADGLIVNYKYFGRNNPRATPNYTLGRTISHEAGHYFDLMHTWGGDGPGEGGCDDDDGIDDTPDCAGQYYAAYHGLILDSCDDPVQCGELRLIADYMDYSVDRCMDVFTLGQIGRMRQAILKYRFPLATYENNVATGCKETYLKYNPTVEDALDILPNPSNGQLHIYPNFVTPENAELYVFDELGRLVKHLSFANLKNQKIDIDMIWAANGIYNLVLVTPKQTYKQKLILQHQ